MRKITQEASRAMKEWRNFKSSNTTVRTARTGMLLSLHGNDIANYGSRGYDLYIRDAGWRTATTKERLNGLLQTVAPGYKIRQHDKQWFLQDKHGNNYAWKGDAYLLENANGELRYEERV